MDIKFLKYNKPFISKLISHSTGDSTPFTSYMYFILCTPTENESPGLTFGSVVLKAISALLVQTGFGILQDTRAVELPVLVSKSPIASAGHLQA